MRLKEKKQLNKLKVAGINKTRGCECVPVDGSLIPELKAGPRFSMSPREKNEKKKKVRVHFNRLNSRSQTSSALLVLARRC